MSRRKALLLQLFTQATETFWLGLFIASVVMLGAFGAYLAAAFIISGIGKWCIPSIVILVWAWAYHRAKCASSFELNEHVRDSALAGFQKLETAPLGLDKSPPA